MAARRPNAKLAGAIALGGVGLMTYLVARGLERQEADVAERGQTPGRWLDANGVWHERA